MIKNYASLVLLLFFNLISYGQNMKNIAGTVTDINGQPLPNVTVITSQSKLSRVTNEKGSFHITNVIIGESITFSMIGYQSQTISVGDISNVKIKLQVNQATIEDVVVIGYGEVKREELTGSVGSANVQDMNKAPVASFEDALAGRVAGVQVTSNDGQPGAASTIVIRGNNSVTQDNSPLYVIDGFPIENPENNTLNPSEIESIEVLKDASATAIYGSRGANGVVIVTTKAGKIGLPVVSYQTWYGGQEVVRKQELLSPYEFVKYQIEYNPETFGPIYENNGRTLESYRDEKGINWQDEIFRRARVNNHFLSLSGGTDKTKYAISGSALRQDGIVLNSGFDRYQGRVRIDQTVNPKLKAGVNLNFTHTKTYGTIATETASGNVTNSLMYSIWAYRPVSANLGDDLLGEFMDDPEIVNPITDGRVNPLIHTTNYHNPVFRNVGIANAYIEYNILKDLKFKITGGANANISTSEIFNNSFTRAGNLATIEGQSGANGSIRHHNLVDFLNENTLSYRKRIKKHHILDVVTGYTMQKRSTSNSGFAANQLPNESLGIDGLDEGNATALYSGSSRFTLSSFLTRATYNYMSKYILSASFRADGSSKFPAGNKWGNFASSSLAWRFGRENFMKKLAFISDAKIRAGYGVTGNNRVTDFAYLAQLGINPSSGYSWGNTTQQGVIPLNLGNQDLRWESTGMFNLGLDLSLFKDRVSFTTDYYKKETYDLLLNATLAGSTGYAAAYKNIGKTSNEGLEFTLNTVNINTKDFTWSTNFNISFNKNRLLQLNEDEPNLRTRVSHFADIPYIAIPGRPIALFYGYIWDGNYQYDDFNTTPDGDYVLKDGVPNNGLARNVINPGYVKYRDINGDGAVNEMDQTIIGNPNPIHIGGFSNNFNYKGFDLNVFFQWSYGNDVLNANRIVFEGQQIRPSLNMFKSVENRWTPENQTNELFTMRGGGNNFYSSRIIEDGSFLRLKTVALGYNLPEACLTRLKLKSLRLYASAQNLITWTNYSGIDPEVSVARALPALTPGYDYSAYPRALTLTFGLNLTL